MNKDEDMDVGRSFKRLSDLQAVTVELQNDATTFANARALCDGVLEKYPTHADRIGENVRIIENIFLERGIANVQRWEEGTVTEGEERAIRHLRENGVIECEASKVVGLSFAERLMQKFKFEMAPDKLKPFCISSRAVTRFNF